MPIEALRPGDLVTTMAAGPQAITWIACSTFSTAQLALNPRLWPVHIARGALGNLRDLIVSPQHCMVVDGPDGVRFARAKHLALETDLATIMVPQRPVQYVHIMLERHHVIFAEGARTESFYPGPQSLAMMDKDARDALLGHLPALDLLGAEVAYGPRALAVLRRRDLSRAVMADLAP